MSVERKYEEKTHVVTERVMTYEHRFCDICGKEITEDFWEVQTHHYDWGNDSVDSYEDIDVCSPACLQKTFDKYINESSESRYNTKAIEVNHCRWANVKGDISYDL